MSKSAYPMSHGGEAGDCVSYRLRRAARVAAKFYDNALRPCGLRNTQFTLLSALDHLGETSIGDLSEELAIDATTLNRNLEVLTRRKLVKNIAVDDGRVRAVRLTAAGARVFAEAKPLWRAAQRKMLRAIGGGEWTDMQSRLHKIETACEGGG